MKQLSASKKKKLLADLKKYRKKFLAGKSTDLDEAATRLMINSFLSDVLGFISIEQIKTEYMIRGTYADYVIQIKGKRYFVVEAKAMSMGLSEKHLRQVINYAANEGIDWALLTNGRQFQLYRVLFNKPIESRQVFSVDLGDEAQLKKSVDDFQHMTEHLLLKRGLDHLWNRYQALEASSFSKLLYSSKIIGHLRRQLKKSYKTKFSDTDIISAVTRVIVDEVRDVKPRKERKRKKHTRRNKSQTIAVPQTPLITASVG